MRWKVEPESELGDWRTVRRFCFLPLTLKLSVGGRETRWLESVKIKQLYRRKWGTGCGWKNVEWEDS